jgi:hypothetical protein
MISQEPTLDAVAPTSQLRMATAFLWFANRNGMLLVQNFSKIVQLVSLY